MKNRKKHIHNKFNNMVSKTLKSGDTKKYEVSKLGKDKYSYHDFVITKVEDDCYKCTSKDVTIYDNVANFQLALSYCYNYTFNKSASVLNKLNKLNEEATKQLIDLMYYKHYLNNAKTEDTEFMYARITESNILYTKVKSDIRNLSTSI